MVWSGDAHISNYWQHVILVLEQAKLRTLYCNYNECSVELLHKPTAADSHRY